MKKNWVIILLAFGIACLIVFRTYFIPITHDESSTWFHCLHLNLWKCFFDPSCWTSANNHWLNTLFMQWCSAVGGERAFVLRIPNMLAGFGYLVAAGLLATRYLNNYATQVSAFLWISLHLYLIDFFCLARGYGMMTCGILWGVYSMMRYIEAFEFRWFLIALSSLVLAVLSNFTALICYVAVLGAGFAWIVFHKKFSVLGRPLIWAGAVSVVLFALLRKPLKWLSAGGEFEWGAKNIRAMWIDLFNNLLGAKNYWDWRKPEVLLIIFLILLVLALVFLFIQFKKTESQPIKISFLILAFVLFTIGLLQLITGAQPPVGRKTIFLIPLLFGTLGLSQGLIRRERVATTIGVLGSAIILFHFFYTLPPALKSTREWYYDAYYPALLSKLTPAGKDSDSVSVGASWIFIPGLIFYQKTDSLPISGLAYHKEFVVDTSMQYYFIDPSDIPRMDTFHYLPDQMFGPFPLYKRKESVH